MKGWVYVISNNAMQGLVKVGFSTKDPDLRAEELNHTGSPHPYEVEYDMLIEEPREIEQKTHQLLSSKREGKEWFRCSAEEAIAAIKQVSGTRAISESYKRAERAKAEALHQQELDAIELRRQREVEAIELRRKREKEQKELEDCLRNEEAIIRKKFDEQIAASFPPRPFWVYWLGSGILAGIGLAAFYPKMSDTRVSMFAALFGALAGWCLKVYFESNRKQSSSYVALEKQRDEELAAVRGRTPSQPTKQEVVESKGNSLVQSQDQIGMERHKKAAMQGIASSQAWLGWMYSSGTSVPQDYVMARQWYEKAAAQGYARGQNNLGELYANGQGVRQDYTKAREWFEKAATQGDALAQNWLGWLYANGQGVPQDYTQARQWYEKAAAKGDATAQSKLGVLYTEGLGVPEDLVQAHLWLSMAAAQGNKIAAQDRDKVVMKMTPAQIAEAQRLVQQCQTRQFKGC